MAIAPKVSQPPQSHAALVQGSSRLGLRGRPTTEPQVEEANPTWVGTEGEWLPAGSARVEGRRQDGSLGQGRGYSASVARLSAGYQANEAVADDDSQIPGGQRTNGGAGLYEANMRLINGTAAVNGRSLDVLY